MQSSKRVQTSAVLMLGLLLVVQCGCSKKSTGPDDFATAIRVPRDYATIQQAINAATDSDVIIVADGHYVERIDFLGKAILVGSEYVLDDNPDHILNTIIDADTSILGSSDTGSVVLFVTGEGSNSQIIGFTIKGGVGTITPYNSGESRFGGGIFCDLTSPTISNCIIEGNSARSGGGIYCHDGSPRIQACTVARNSSVGLLGIGDSLSLIVDRSEIIEHSSYGIRFVGGKLTVDNCSFIGNKDSGLYIVKGVDILVTGCDFDGNYAVAGGGIWAYFCNITIENCSFSDNRAMAGAGVFISGCLAQITGCTFTGNMCHFYGGAVTSHGSELAITNCLIEHNWSEECSGVYAMRSQVSITRCIVARNSVMGYPPWPTGALAFGGLGSIVISNSTVYGNYCGEVVISFEDSVLATLENNVIANNTGELPVRGENVELSCCNVFGNSGGDWIGNIEDQYEVRGNLSADPMFCDTLNSNFRLREDSPCAPSNNDCGILIGALAVGCPVP